MMQTRTYAFDNYRTFLTTLVILHHAVIPYGGSGNWPYTSSHHAAASSPPLLAFNVINQTFFMAAFFLLSGYFSSIAAKKRGRGDFMWEKWKRLGVPTLAYSVLGTGANRAIVAARGERAEWDVVAHEFLAGAWSVRGVRGPVWYCALLLIFDGVFALVSPGRFKRVTSDATNSTSESKKLPRPLRTRHVFAILAASSLAAFLVRLIYPVGTAIKLLSLQPAFLPQYIVCYFAGHYIQRKGYKIHDAVSSRSVYLIGISALFIMFSQIAIVFAKLEHGTPVPLLVELSKGGWNPLALGYALLNEFVGFVLGVLLLKAFHNPKLSFLSKRWHILNLDLGKYSFAAFLVHVLVLVDIQCTLVEDSWRGAVQKAGFVSVTGVMKSWIAGVVLKAVVDVVFGRSYI